MSAAVGLDPRTRLLAQYLAAAPSLPFDWGMWNCCHFAAGWVRAACGFDPMCGLPFTGSAREALRLVQALGGSLGAAWTRQLGVGPVPVAEAEIGDLLLLPLPLGAAEDAHGRTGQAVGICTGVLAVVCAPGGGFAFTPASAAAWAWRLPAPRGAA